MTSRVATVGHLAARFFGAIRPGPPDPFDEQWAIGHLASGEIQLWRRMSNPDRRHAIDVARAVVDTLGPHTDRAVVAAALMHDVGKVVSDYRTPARVVATLVWAVVPRQRAHRWRSRRPPFRRLAEYRLHPELGEELLLAAGADPITAGWAGDHHRPADAWRVDRSIGQVLKDCDDD